MNTEPNGLPLLGPNPKVRSVLVVVAISFFWSASANAGFKWIDAAEQACPDICKADKGENGSPPEQNAVPIAGRHQYYVCAGHVVGSPPKDERGGSNDGTACIVADHSGTQTLARYKCLCTSDKVDRPLW
jgi:hypothetical protein